MNTVLTRLLLKRLWKYDSITRLTVMSEMLPLMHGALFPVYCLSYPVPGIDRSVLYIKIAVLKYNTCIKTNIEFQNTVLRREVS